MTGTLSHTSTSLETLEDQTLDDNGKSQQEFSHHTIAHLIIFVVMVLASLLGVVANTLIVIMFRRCTKLRSTTNLFVEVLAYLDLTMAVVGLPITAISALKGYFIGDHLWAVITGFAMTYLGLSNINILTAIAVERYVCIVHPHRKIHNSPSVAAQWIASCLGIPLIWSIAPLCGWNYYALEGTDISASVNWVVTQPAEIAYISLLFITSFFIPATIISYSYCAILQEIRSVARNSTWGPDHYLTRKNIKMETKMVKTTAAIVVSFLVTWLPYAVVSLMTAIRGKEAVHPLVGTMPAILAKCSCAINPLIYVATNTQFRREFEKRLCGRRPTGKRDGTLNGSFGTTIQGSTRTQQSTMHTLDTGPYNEHIAMTTIKEDCKMDADAIAMENCGDTTPLGYGDSSDDNKDALLEEEVTTDASDGRRESIDSI